MPNRIDGNPFFALEYVDGGHLADRLAGAPQSATESATLIEKLARAVHYAHECGIVHRDLKPANILLTSQGEPKITDFGLAKSQNEDWGLTVDGDVLGTPSYMSPEQAWGKNEDVGPASDIYALGILLYEMLTGKPPFKTAHKHETIQLVRTTEPVKPRTLIPQIPRDLELICLKCLETEPRERFASAKELADELRLFLEGCPIKTRPAPVWERAWKWSRRNPMAALFILMSLAALCTGGFLLEQRARSAEHLLQAKQRTFDMREKVLALHVRSREALDRAVLQDAQGYLQAASVIMGTERLLADLKPEHDALQEETVGKMAAQDAWHAFQKRHDEALFYGMVFTGVDLPSNVNEARKACQEALAIYGFRSEATPTLRFSKYDSDERKRQGLVACYELLLIWAEAEAQAEPAQAENRFAKSLRLLNGAADLRLTTESLHRRRAHYLQQRGDVKGALAELDAAARTPARTALDFFLLADAQQKKGRFDEAAHFYASALTKQPDHFWARYFLAVCNLQTQQPADARNNLTACLNARPNYLYLHLLRGIAQGQLNNFPAAEEDFEQALALTPDRHTRYGILVNRGVVCLRQARLADAGIPHAGPSSTLPDVLFFSRGLANAIRVPRLQSAREYLLDAVKLQPDHFAAYRYLAQVSLEERDGPASIAWQTQAIDASQGQTPAVRAPLFSVRARLLREQKQWAAARADLNLALDLAPRAEDFAERGRLWFAERRYVEALRDYDASLALMPRQAEVYLWKAEALRLAYPGVPVKQTEAIDCLTAYLEQGGQKSPVLFRARGLMRARLQQFGPALADYEQALDMQRDSATYADRGWVHLACESAVLALHDFQEALRLDPNNGEAHAGRGLIAVRKGTPLDAVGYAERALQDYEKASPRLLWNVAHVYAQLVGYLDAAPQKSPATGSRAYFERKAVSLLEQALLKMPPAQRYAFWQQYVARDALLNPLRGGAGFERLQRDVEQNKERVVSEEL